MASTNLKNISQNGNLSQSRDEPKKYLSCRHPDKDPLPFWPNHRSSSPSTAKSISRMASQFFADLREDLTDDEVQDPSRPKKEQKKYTRNLTWNLKIMVSKWTFLFQGLIFRSHVKFRGCICLKIPKLQNVQNMSHIFYSELILDQPDTNKQ